MRILQYISLDTSRVAKSYRKVVDAIAADDFRAAQVKKLSNISHGKFYRARLDDAKPSTVCRRPSWWSAAPAAARPR